MWEHRQIDEDGGMGSARRDGADAWLFAWGAGMYPDGEPHPGGWSRWVEDEDGDLDDQTHHVTDPAWTEEQAKAAADAATVKG